MSALKILIIPGSLRTGSLNAKLAAAAAQEFVRAGADVTRISLGDFPLPIYDGDLQTKSGVPKNAVNLKRMIGTITASSSFRRNIIRRCRRCSRIPSTG